MIPRPSVIPVLAVLAASCLSSLTFAAGEASRAPVEGCAWKQITDAGTGLVAWVQACNFGEGRTLGYVFDGNTLAQKSSDFEELTVVAEVFDMERGEMATDALNRVYAGKTDKAVAEACVLRKEDETELPEGIARYSFVPGTVLQQKIDAETLPGDMPENGCGAYGMVYDSVQYFQTIDGADKILFLSLGQDEPLFDDLTLSFVSP